jgi:hypothetical protein
MSILLLKWIAAKQALGYKTSDRHNSYRSSSGNVLVDRRRRLHLVSKHQHKENNQYERFRLVWFVGTNKQNIYLHFGLADKAIL